MTTKQQRRLESERKAAQFLEENHPKLAALFEDVVVDLGKEWVGLPKAQLRARQAAEMAYRLDKMTDLSGFSPLAEALDFFGFYLGCLAFLGIVDAVEAAARRKKERVGKLKKRLELNGDKMARSRKRQIERRIARLEAAIR